MTQDFQLIDWGGNDVRRIERDSTGRVAKIVAGEPGHHMLDSVMYKYDPVGPVDTIIRSTLAYLSTATSDTIVFTYDTARVTSTAARCNRLRSMRDAMGGVTKTLYDTTGASSPRWCLPWRVIGLSQDTTIFAYGNLAVGDSAGARPVSVRDPVGITVTMQYHKPTWNSAVSIRVAANDTSRIFYSPFGLPDSVKDGVGIRTFYEYDQSGRVIRAKTGTGSLAPTTATFYNRSGLTDSVRVYPSNDAALASPTGTVQTTKYFYNRLGWVDSTIYPGGRRQTFVRYRDGNPMYEYSGNGSFVGRAFDWQGRLVLEAPSQVGPDYRMNGDSFATHASDSVYRALGLRYGFTLSSGQTHQYTYDNKGRVSKIRTADIGLGTSDQIVRDYAYSPTGQLTWDVLRYPMEGLTVTRNYRYNRRGQRTSAATNLSVSSGSILQPNDSLLYFYDSLTARLDSMVGKVDSVGGDTLRSYGAVKWLYDRAGRDTLQRVTPWENHVAWPALATRTTYDAAGRVNLLSAIKSGHTWYQFSSPIYTRIDELTDGSLIESSGLSSTFSHTYATDGTRRLLITLNRAGTYSYSYDVFGNRLSENRTSTSSTGCPENNSNTSTFSGDNAITRTSGNCAQANRYWNDKGGNRLAQIDTTSGGSYDGYKNVMSYTAKNQLFFSMSPTGQVGTYDYNWHWYDAAGRRALSRRSTGLSWVPADNVFTASARTFYVYDGGDIGLMVVKQGSGWWVKSRYLTGGVDNNLLGRFTRDDGLLQNLLLVNDRLGSTLAALHADNTREFSAQYFDRDPYGGLLGASGTGGTINTETGFAGASTPNASGGFVYLRNRWYDPKTGRFLTQDPIGLAGGVNLYSYAGNNPVAYTDPFGLCPPPPGTFDPLCFAVNLSAGFGDAVTFGLTAMLRGDADAQVDKSSAVYTAGQVAGVAASAALGGAVAKTIQEGGIIATSAPARAGGRLLVRAGESLFGTGGKLNTGGALRIGVGKLGGQTGRAVLRVAGSAVKAATGAEHVYLVDLGRLAEWFH